MLFTAGKNKTDIRQKLDVGTQQGFHPFFRIFRDLLEFVNGDIATFFRRLQVVEYLF